MNANQPPPLKSKTSDTWSVVLIVAAVALLLIGGCEDLGRFAAVVKASNNAQPAVYAWTAPPWVLYGLICLLIASVERLRKAVIDGKNR